MEVDPRQFNSIEGSMRGVSRRLKIYHSFSLSPNREHIIEPRNLQCEEVSLSNEDVIWPIIS